MADWRGGVFLDADISAPEITQDIIDNGLVFVYRKIGSDNTILKLNFTDFNGWNNIFMTDIITLTKTVHSAVMFKNVI